MAPTAIRMVLVEGENADGVTVDEDSFGIAADSAGLSAADQVISAILGTREGAAEGGYQLASTGVTWTNPADAAALGDALAAHKVSNVMLVSAFLAAAALAQTVGSAIDYQHIALLYVEPETATLAVVNSDDGSVTDVYRRPLRSADVTAELATMVAGLDGLETRPGGLFVVGSGVDIAPIKPALEAATWLPVSAPEEPDTALARGAALASANAPLFASSTAAVAYAQDPGTGEVNPFAVAPGYFEVTAGRTGAGKLAYSAVADEDADAGTGVMPAAGGDTRRERGPLLLLGSALAAFAAAGAVATVIALAVNIRQTVAFLPTPVQHLIIPTEQAPAPPPAAQVPAPVSAPQPPAAVHLAAPAAPAPVPVPAAPAPPIALPAPAPIPAAPAPVPVLVPIPVPVPIRVPVPAVPVQAPVAQPPVNLPIPKPPAQTPTPPAHVPTPPVQTPTPPARVPTPPVRAPSPPVQVPAPKPPVNLPAPEPPMRLPTPAGPQLASTPAPLMPRMPAPAAPAVPRMPAMPAPVMPRMPAMPAPAMPAMPRFNFPMPAFRF